MMRNILVTYALRHQREKRGGGAVLVSLDLGYAVAIEPASGILELDEHSISWRSSMNASAKLWKLRFFGGLSEEETAEVLRTSVQYSANGTSPGHGCFGS